MIAIDRLSVRLEDGSWSAPLPAMKIASGQWWKIAGQSGVGKTRLGLALCGLLDPGLVRGSIVIHGRSLTELSQAERVRLVAWVPSDPRLLFSGMKSTLEGELDLAWQVFGTDGLAIQRELPRLIDAFSLSYLLGRDPFTLSGGEAARAAFALAVAKRPLVLVLDQAFVAFHPDWKAEISTILRTLVPECAIIELAARRDNQTPADKIIDLPLPDSHQASSASQLRLTPTDQNRPSKDLAADGSLLVVQGLTYRYQSGFAIGPIDLHIEAGQCIALVGPNGAGKTTLLRSLALLNEPQWVVFRVRDDAGNWFSPPSKRKHEWARKVLYVFQNPDDQIYLPTVRAEILETCRWSGKNQSDSDIARTVSHFHLSGILEQSPFDQSRAVRRLITLAAAFAADPPVLLLDEPTAQLDALQTELCAEAIVRRSAMGKSTAAITHDPELLRLLKCRIVEVREGQIYLSSNMSVQSWRK